MVNLISINKLKFFTFSNLFSLLQIFCSEIHKVLTKISKEKGCEVLSEWIKPCQNHLMWSATSTPSGNGQLIWAKFKSYLSHIVNKHKDLDEPIFNKCSHGDNIPQRRWLEEGMCNFCIMKI